jgi:predicted Fe-Mo cluster-binding NifX family protein
MLAPSLRAAGVEVLLCGAISRGWQGRLEASGIRVVPFLTGSWRQLLAALRAGELDRDDYRMPGCRGMGPGCRRRQRGGRGNGHNGREQT